LWLGHKRRLRIIYVEPITTTHTCRTPYFNKKNFKALALRVISLLNCSTTNFLSNVELLTRTCYTIVSLISVSPSIHLWSPLSGSSFIIVSLISISPSIHLCSPLSGSSFIDIHVHLYHCCCCLREPAA